MCHNVTHTLRHDAQALAKLERGFDQDLADVKAMLDRGLVDRAWLRRFLVAIEPDLYRFPAVHPAALPAAVETASHHDARLGLSISGQAGTRACSSIRR
jgi:hypothetical protein